MKTSKELMEFCKKNTPTNEGIKISNPSIKDLEDVLYAIERASLSAKAQIKDFKREQDANPFQWKYIKDVYKSIDNLLKSIDNLYDNKLK